MINCFWNSFNILSQNYSFPSLPPRKTFVQKRLTHSRYLNYLSISAWVILVWHRLGAITEQLDFHLSHFFKTAGAAGKAAPLALCQTSHVTDLDLHYSSIAQINGGLRIDQSEVESSKSNTQIWATFVHFCDEYFWLLLPYISEQYQYFRLGMHSSSYFTSDTHSWGLSIYPVPTDTMELWKCL